MDTTSITVHFSKTVNPSACRESLHDLIIKLQSMGLPDVQASQEGGLEKLSGQSSISTAADCCMNRKSPAEVFKSTYWGC